MTAKNDLQKLFEHDYSDFGSMLSSIGGWTVGCENHLDYMNAVERAKAEGLVGTRVHKAPIEPRGWPCFELTDAGIEKVRELRGDKAAADAIRQRQWYRDNAAKYD